MKTYKKPTVKKNEVSWSPRADKSANCNSTSGHISPKSEKE